MYGDLIVSVPKAIDLMHLKRVKRKCTEVLYFITKYLSLYRGDCSVFII